MGDLKKLVGLCVGLMMIIIGSIVLTGENQELDYLPKVAKVVLQC